MDNTENLPIPTSSPHEPANTPKTSRLIEVFLRTLDSPQTIKTYNTELRMFDRFVEEKFDKGLQDINAEDISVYREHLLKNYSSATSAKKLTVLRRFLTFAYMGGECRVNPEALKFFAKSPRVRQDPSYNILTEDEVSRMLSAAVTSNQRDYVMIALLVSCGLRESEVVAVTLADFREVGEIGEDQVQLRVLGKGDKIRNVSISPDMWEIVQKFAVYSGKSFTSQSDARRPLFESREGTHRPLTTRSVRYIVKKYVKLAGIQKAISPHSLRHTAGTNMAKNEAPLIIIQGHLGHSDPKTTMRYIRRAEELANRAYQYNTLPLK